jgi:hypothetical protein
LARRRRGVTTDEVFKIVRILISLACLVGFAWFGATVELGGRTLFGHLYAISQSRESQDLYKGAKDKVGGMFGDDKPGAPKGNGDDEDNAGKGKIVQRPATNKNGGASGSARPGDKQAVQAGDVHTPGAAPQENLDENDRGQMRKLLETARDKLRAEKQ